jgi:hypothetical protein
VRVEQTFAGSASRSSCRRCPARDVALERVFDAICSSMASRSSSDRLFRDLLLKERSKEQISPVGAWRTRQAPGLSRTAGRKGGKAAESAGSQSVDGQWRDPGERADRQLLLAQDLPRIATGRPRPRRSDPGPGWSPAGAPAAAQLLGAGRGPAERDSSRGHSPHRGRLNALDDAPSAASSRETRRPGALLRDLLDGGEHGRVVLFVKALARRGTRPAARVANIATARACAMFFVRFCPSDRRRWL